jgi:hypothetical protein
MKLVRYMILGMVPALMLACGAEGPDDKEQYEEDRVGASDFELGTPLTDEEISQLPVLGGKGDVDESVSAVAAASCWVTLNYCRHPSTGKSTCTATAGCTRPASICASLIDDICGNLNYGGVGCSRMSSSSRWTCSSTY